MKKSGFTLEKHAAVGAKLKSIRNELVYLSVDIANTYTKDILEKLDEAIKNIDRVRSDLDDRVCKENPDLDDKTVVSCYY